MGTMSKILSQHDDNVGDVFQEICLDDIAMFGARRTLDDQVRTEDSHAAHTDTGLSGTIGGTEAGEDDSGRAAQRTEEGLG